MMRGRARTTTARGHRWAGAAAGVLVTLVGGVVFASGADAAPVGSLAVTVQAHEPLTVTALTPTGTAPATPGTSTSSAAASGQALRVDGLADGTYLLGLHRVEADTPWVAGYLGADGFVPESRGPGAAAPVVVSGGAEVVLAPLAPVRGGTAVGAVQDAAGTAVAGARVRALTSDGSRSARLAVTDEAGRFVVRGLDDGAYTLSVEAPATDASSWACTDGTTTATAPLPARLGQEVAVGTVTLPAVSPGASAFADVVHGRVFATEIAWLAQRGITTGWQEANGSRTFRPEQAVRRDEMAAFLYRAAGSPAYTPPAVSPFSDVPTTRVFFKEIAWLRAQAISTGWVEADGTRTFRPGQPVLRDEMAAFLHRAAGRPAVPAAATFRDVSADRVFAGEIRWLAASGISKGWTEGDGTATFRPGDRVLRDAMAAFLHRARNLIG